MAFYFHKIFVACLLLQLRLLPAIAGFWQYHMCTPKGENDTLTSNKLSNLDVLLGRIGTEAENNNGYFNDTAGTKPDKVYGLIMCYADADRMSCNDCLSAANAIEVTRQCPDSSDAAFW